MRLKRFVLGAYQSNTYILYKDYKAMIIDCGGPTQEVIAFLEKEALALTTIYITHGHVDHGGGINDLKRRYPSAIVYAPIKDRFWYAKNPQIGLNEDIIIDKYVKENDVVPFLDVLFKVIETPGHSYGSTCLYYDEVLFSGDTLFKRSIGRTDLYLGNHKDIISSIKNKLFVLPKSTVVYSGHGDPTTIEQEMKYNPFLKE